jgi:hypothetical protein
LPLEPVLPLVLCDRDGGAAAPGARDPGVRAIIAKLYPQRVPKRPGPPDPGPLFSPILLPKAGPVANSGFVFRSAATGAPQPEGEIDSAEAARRFDAAAADRLKGSASLVTFDGSPVSAGAALLDQAEMLTLAKLADRFKILPFCDVEPAPGLLLRFQEYDRTDRRRPAAPIPRRGRARTLASPPPTSSATISSASAARSPISPTRRSMSAPARCCPRKSFPTSSCRR